MKLIFSVILLNPVYSKIISVAFLLLFLSKCRKKHQKQELLFLYFQVIQGGAVYDVSRGYNLTFPVSFLSTERVVGNDMSSVSEAGMQVISFGNVSNTGATICAMRINQTDSNVWCHWLAIGR